MTPITAFPTPFPAGYPRLTCTLPPLLLASLLAACGPATTATLPPTPTEPPATAIVPAPTATASPTPTRTPNPFPNPVLKVVGEEEIVFDWTTDRCEQENIPDLAARALRDASGQVHLIISHYVNYQMLGPDLNTVTSDCSRPILRSDFDPDPAAYNDAEWLAAPYTEDGQVVYALAHNEYRGHTHPGQCPSGDYFDCLDTSITLAISTDGGLTYADAAGPPAHLIATLPYQAQPGAGPFGMRNPSNIIRGQDGYYYAYSNISQYETQEQWVCLMRTDDLSDPAAWRFWDGGGFDGLFANPYLEAALTPADHTCAPLDWDDIGASLNESVTFNTYLNRYVLVGISADQIEGREVWGFYYAFSADLIHWTHRKLLTEIALPWRVADAGRDVSYLYPSLLDPASESRNFDTTGETAHLYFTRHNFGQGSLDRDLIRLPVRFFPSEGAYRDSLP